MFTHVCDSNESESKYKRVLLRRININRLVPSLASIKRVMTRRSICGTAARHRAERNIFMRDKAISFAGVEGKRALFASLIPLLRWRCGFASSRVDSTPWHHARRSREKEKKERVREKKRETVQTFVGRSYSKITPVTVVSCRPRKAPSQPRLPQKLRNDWWRITRSGREVLESSPRFSFSLRLQACRVIDPARREEAKLHSGW